MQVTIEKNLNKKIKDVSKALGVNEKQVIERAILFYFENIKNSVSLKKELKIWDELSDEALMKMRHEKR
jgi:hypothetical protein